MKCILALLALSGSWAWAHGTPIEQTAAAVTKTLSNFKREEDAPTVKAFSTLRVEFLKDDELRTEIILVDGRSINYDCGPGTAKPAKWDCRKAKP